MRAMVRVAYNWQCNKTGKASTAKLKLLQERGKLGGPADKTSDTVPYSAMPSQQC